MTSSVANRDRQCTCGSWWQLRNHCFEANAGDVSQLLLVGQHVGAERIHNGLHLVLLHFANQRAQAVGGEASQDEWPNPTAHVLQTITLLLLKDPGHLSGND